MNIDDFKKIKITAMKNHDKDAVTALNAVINKLMLVGIEKRLRAKRRPTRTLPKFCKRR